MSRYNCYNSYFFYLMWFFFPHLMGGTNPNGGSVPQKYSFEIKGIPHIHGFTLNWDESRTKLSSIDIHLIDNGEKIQTIGIPDNTVSITLADIMAPQSKDLREKIIEAIDYNFDGQPDLRILRSWPYVVGSKTYLIYLFDPEKNQYIFNESLSSLPAPTPDNDQKLIISTDMGNFAGSEFIIRSYKVNQDGTIDVIKKITQKITNAKEMTYEKKIYIKTKGNLELRCKFVMPYEGLPKLVWGPQKTCKKLSESRLNY